jgi:hypothetical protein
MLTAGPESRWIYHSRARIWFPHRESCPLFDREGAPGWPEPSREIEPKLLPAAQQLPASSTTRAVLRNWAVRICLASCSIQAALATCRVRASDPDSGTAEFEIVLMPGMTFDYKPAFRLRRDKMAT